MLRHGDGCSSPEMVASYIFLLLHLLFSVDILISFRVAFHENEALVTDPALTAKNYRRCLTARHLPNTPTLLLLTSFQLVSTSCEPTKLCHIMQQAVVLLITDEMKATSTGKRSTTFFCAVWLRMMSVLGLHAPQGVATLYAERRCMAASQLLADPVCCTCRIRFWWDLTAWIPWDYLALLVMGDFHAGSSIVARVPLLRLLRLVREMMTSDLIPCNARVMPTSAADTTIATTQPACIQHAFSGSRC